MAFDGSGNLYAGNQGNGTITRFDQNGNASAFVSGVSNPYGLAFDVSGNLYVATATRIMRYGQQGTSVVFADLGYPYYVEDIAFGSGGNLYVADLNVNDASGRVLMLDASGHASVVLSGLERPSSLAVEPVPEPSAVALLCAAAAIHFRFPSRAVGRKHAA